jgi:hypothetical protein
MLTIVAVCVFVILAQNMLRLIFCLWALWTQICRGYVDEISTHLSDATVKRVRNRFGMAKEAEVRIRYRLSRDDVNVLALVIDDPQYFGWYQTRLNSKDVDRICSLPSMFRAVLSGNGSISYSIRATDKYSVLLVLCDDLSLPVDLFARVEMVNPTIEQDGWSHLPIEKVQTLRLWLGNFLAFLCMTLVLMGQVYFSK